MRVHPPPSTLKAIDLYALPIETIWRRRSIEDCTAGARARLVRGSESKTAQATVTTHQRAFIS
jgi:hypothetical protein